jgi:hypothetical protein
MGVEVVTKEDLRNEITKLNKKIWVLKQNKAWLPIAGEPWMMSMKQVQYKLGIGPDTVKLLIKKGLLKPRRLTEKGKGKMFFLITDVMEFVGLNPDDYELPLQQNGAE